MNEKINMQDEYVLAGSGKPVKVYTVTREHVSGRCVAFEIENGNVLFANEFGLFNGRRVIIKKPVKK